MVSKTWNVWRSPRAPTVHIAASGTGCLCQSRLAKRDCCGCHATHSLDESITIKHAHYGGTEAQATESQQASTPSTLAQLLFWSWREFTFVVSLWPHGWVHVSASWLPWSLSAAKQKCRGSPLFWTRPLFLS